MPSSFTTPLRLEFDYDGNPRKPFVIIEAFTYVLGHEDGDEWITVPVGFRTDFASIPRPFRNIFSPTGSYGKAAVVHDYLYNGGYISALEETGDDVYEIRRDVTRKEADDVLLEAMTVLGVRWWTRHLVYWAVRLGGWTSFER